MSYLVDLQRLTLESIDNTVTEHTGQIRLLNASLYTLSESFKEDKDSLNQTINEMEAELA